MRAKSYPAFTSKYHRFLQSRARKIGQYTTQFPLEPRYEYLVVGYTTNEHLLLDHDKATGLSSVVGLTRMIINEHHEVGCCLLCASSEHGYHAIYDNKITWKQITTITETLAGLNILNRDYMKIRKFREDLTLRVSSVDRGLRKSPAPLPLAIVLCPHCRPDFEIGSYIECGMILDAWDGLRLSGFCEYLSVLTPFRDIRDCQVRLI